MDTTQMPCTHYIPEKSMSSRSWISPPL